MLRPYRKQEQHPGSTVGSSMTRTKKMLMVVLGLVGLLVVANLIEHEVGLASFLKSIEKSHRSLCSEPPKGVLTSKLSAFMSLSSESTVRRFLCEWVTELDHATFEEAFPDGSTYGDDPSVTPPDTTVAFVVTIPSCPEDETDIDDPGAAFYDAAAVLKDSICNNTNAETSGTSNNPSDSLYNSTMYAVIHPDAVFCEGPTAQTGGSSSTSRRLEGGGYQYDRVKLLEDLGYWVKILAQPAGTAVTRDFMKLYAYKMTTHDVAVMVKFDSVVVDKLDSLLSSFMNSSAKSYYDLDDNALVNTGNLMVKTSDVEYDSILSGYQNDATYTGGASVAEYLLHYYSTPGHFNEGTLSSVIKSFGLESACGKPWQCLYNETWDSATNDTCRELNQHWYDYRASFETRWSKTDLVDTTLGTYRPDFFDGYCYGPGADAYQRAADHETTQEYACPSNFDEPLDIGVGGSVKLNFSDSMTLCTLTKVMTDGSHTTPIPIARSYDSYSWEKAAGPTATGIFADDSSLSCDGGTLTCVLTLPALTGAKYVLTKFTNNPSIKDTKARFLEKTTFGQTNQEIDNLSLSDLALHVKTQMNLPESSHREYWRQRTSPKWMFTTANARSDHPCDANSLWRRYTFTRFDRYGDNFEYPPFYIRYLGDPPTTLLYFEAEDAEPAAGWPSTGNFQNSSPGYTGTGYRRIYGRDPVPEVQMEWNVNVNTTTNYGFSIRYAYGTSDYSFPGNEYSPFRIEVNNVSLPEIDFLHTDGGSRWHYTPLIQTSLNAGSNKVTLFVESKTYSTIHIDHLRIGSPRKVAIEYNGNVRSVVDGIKLSEDFDYEFQENTPYYNTYWPIAPSIRYERGRTIVTIENGTRHRTDMGNPPIDFTLAEDQIVNNWFEPDTDPWFSLPESGPEFTETYTQIDYYQLLPNQERHLVNGLADVACNAIPNRNDIDATPVFGRQPDGTWWIWSPAVMLEENTPSSPQSDGGGGTSLATGKTLCMNAPRTFLNEETCQLSYELNACKSSGSLSSADIVLDDAAIISFHNLTEGARWVYAMKGLVHDVSDNPCDYLKDSRWEVTASSTCSSPSTLGNDTIDALHEMFRVCDDTNPIVRDCQFPASNSPYYCTAGDESLVDIELQYNGDCYKLVHPDHLNVYDVTGWVSAHPGGAEKIMKWADAPYPGWYLIFPSNTPGVFEHPMSRWDNNGIPPNFGKVGKYLSTVKFRDLPNDLRTSAIAEAYGADPDAVVGNSIMVCGSVGEVANDPSLGDQFNLIGRQLPDTSSQADYNQQKASVWYEMALSAPDQLRQRAAWALSQIVVVVPEGVNAFDRTEIFLWYYDIFVRNAFGNYLDILKETSYSPLMAEHLSYLDSKSHAYVYENENKRVAFADENFAREVMQLFSVGLNKLNQDGTPVLDSNNGQPLQVYTNEDIMSFARAWTGFRRQACRGNIEDDQTGSTSNRMDPMTIESEWRDSFPKTDLDGGYIGDRYPLCVDLPEKMFLKQGATYRLLGGNPLPELMKEDERWYQPDIKKFVLNETESSLYTELYNLGNYQPLVTLQTSLPCAGQECLVDTVRVVKVADVFYEYKQHPCVQQAFYNYAKKVERQRRHYQGTICANPELPHAGEACCDQSDRLQVRDASRDYFYENERMTYATAESRCGSLCDFRYTVRPDGDSVKTHDHWTTTDCSIQAKVNGEGMVAIVHDTSNLNTLQLHVSEESMNYFSVYWGDNGGDEYPSSSNNCGNGACKLLAGDNTCLCQANVENEVAFSETDINSISVNDIVTQLKVGHMDPTLYPEYDGTITGTDFTAYTQNGNVDDTTVFSVTDDKGRALFLKNVRSTVKLQGWVGTPPIIIEAEAAENTLVGVDIVQDTNSRATGPLNQYANFNGAYNTTGLGAYIDWRADVATAGQYQVRLRYSHGDANSFRPLKITVNGVVTDPDYDFAVSGDNTYFRYTDYINVTLDAGENHIVTESVEQYNDNGPNLDHLRLEGFATDLTYSFPNPVHFMGLIFGDDERGEVTMRDAQYETDAVLEHYFYHDNVAPFLCIRFIQRFGISNPSPRYVAECSNAFKTGSYANDGQTFGTGNYGDLEATFAAVVLDRESINVQVDADPSSGSLREPILKLMALMRSMNYHKKTNEPVVHMPSLEDKFGQSPYEFPSVFSFFLPEYIPSAGPAQVASLTAPEGGLVDLPKSLNMLNGMMSLVKFGLSDCEDTAGVEYGLGTYFGFGTCNDNGVYERAHGYLDYSPTGSTLAEKIDDLSTLLTAGRLSQRSKDVILDAASPLAGDEDAQIRLAQQLIITSPEFHSTGVLLKPDLNTTRPVPSPPSGSGAGYKAVVYVFLGGGCDSYNMLTPHTCPSTGLWEKYVAIRENVALYKDSTTEENVWEIPAGNSAQPCDSFGIHSRLPLLKNLYDQNQAIFVANTGVLAKPVDVTNYRTFTPVQLFAHNAMQFETKKVDVYEEIKGTGVLGRIGAELNKNNKAAGAFSINGNQITLIGKPGEGTPPIAIGSRGLPAFNPIPTLPNMTSYISDINEATSPMSSFMAETWSLELSSTLRSHEILYDALDATSVTENFPDTGFGRQLKMVSRLLQTAGARGVDADLFYVQHGSYDTHASVKENLENKFDDLNDSLQAFVDEVKVLGLWDNIVIAEFSEFARTLNPNSGAGTDHAWGGNHFMIGGKVNGGKVIGTYPDEFVEGLSNIALSRGRMIPTTPWEASWQGIAQWMGLTGAEIDLVIPNRDNFDTSVMFNEADLFTP